MSRKIVLVQFEIHEKKTVYESTETSMSSSKRNLRWSQYLSDASLNRAIREFYHVTRYE